MRKLDQATGAIAGLIVGFILHMLAFREGGTDSAPWQALPIFLSLFGGVGFFIGRMNEYKR